MYPLKQLDHHKRATFIIDYVVIFFFPRFSPIPPTPGKLQNFVSASKAGALFAPDEGNTFMSLKIEKLSRKSLLLEIYRIHTEILALKR